MTSHQESHFSMQLVARDFLIQNAVTTATLPNFAVYFAVIQAGISKVSIIRERQELDKKGIATNKRLLKINLIAQAIDISRKIVAYSSYVNNDVLLEEINYSETKLKESPDTILKDRCQVIYAKAFANLAALDTYGVTDAVLVTFLDTINSYNSVIPKPRLGTLETKEATRQLALLLKNIDENYTKIDTLVGILKASNPEFYNQYKTSRKIIYTGRQTTALIVSVNDSVGNEISKASALITNVPKKSNNKEVINEISKKTGTKGSFRIVNLVEGNYKITIKKIGYTEKSLNFTVISGETTKLVAILESISSAEIQ